MDYTKFGSKSISKFILGGNPISGFSHQGTARDREMRAYYTDEQAVTLLHEAQNLGVNAWVARADDHILGILRQFRAAGGEINWLAQSAPELGDPLVSAERAAHAGAAGCHIHGGVMDFYLAQNRLDEVAGIIQRIRASGMLAGIAGHNPAIFTWAREHLDVDYFMCAYYNPTPRDEHPEHIHGAQEEFLESDRQAMMLVIPTLERPVIHYKILAAGRNNPREAFQFAARQMRPCDCACIGVYSKDMPGMLHEDIDILFESLAETSRKL
jgi:hypothetical protein